MASVNPDVELWDRSSRRRQTWTQREVITCMLGGNMSLHLCLFHGNKITGCAANRKHPLFFIHMKRHMTDKLDIQLCFKSTHMTTGGRRKLEILKSMLLWILCDIVNIGFFKKEIHPDQLLVLQTVQLKLHRDILLSVELLLNGQPCQAD